MSSGYNALIGKLDEFIRKYYKNQMIRGLIYSTGLILGAYLLVALLEYFGNFETGTRTVLFYAFVATTVFVLGRSVLLPLTKLLSLGSTISHEKASLIIGQHFPDVEDKLLNTLQLREQAQASGDNSLIIASIDQRIGELKPVPFTSAIDFTENRKYLKYALPPLAVIAIILFAAPSVLTESTERLVKHGVEIEKIAPYSIEILNESLEVPESDDFTVDIKLDGDVIPEKIYVVVNGQQLKLVKDDNVSFHHTFRNVQESTEFQFYADGFYSNDYNLTALPAPVLLNFDVALNYPDYTGKKDELLANTGDMTVPMGTKIDWSFITRNTDLVEVKFRDSTHSLAPTGSDLYQLGMRAMENESYSVHTNNEFLKGRDSILYRINVVPDLYPLIAVNEEEDSTSKKHLYFTGEVKDDYGFKRLTFNYSMQKAEGAEGDWASVDMGVNRNNTQDQFFHHWDLAELEIEAGDKLTYYFEIWDNDGVNGSKSSRTQSRVYAAPTLDDLIEERDQENADMKDDLEESIDDARKLQKDLEELRKDLLEKEEMSWQDRKKIEEILEQQRTLQDKVEKMQDNNEQKNQKQSEFKQPNEELAKKQEQLQELFDELMTDEMKEMMEELERLMEELDMEEIQEQVEKMDMSTEDMEKELDRMLEQFKQMEWEQKMEEAVEKLEELAEKQEDLSEESEEKDSDSEELKEMQDELNKEFEELEKELEEIEKLNEDLENPNDMPETEEQQESIEQEMQESSDKLGEQKKKSASKSQKSASEQMKQMAQKMEEQMQQQEEEKMEEDMDALRALLENIITLSFDEEKLMEDLKQTDRKDPKYVTHAQQQRKLKDDAKMVEDSLFALSKRIVQLQAAVNREIGLVNDNMQKALDEMGERRTDRVTGHQQYVMTSFNNLALLLDEALKQMQKDCSCKKPGTGNCEKPGGMGSKPSAAQMNKMQKALAKQLEKFKAEQGKNNSGGKMSKELAQMAAKQAAIRREVEKMSQKLNEDGSGSGNGFKEIAKEMEELERDLVNKRVDTETMRRQEDILIRLLKAENAERQREKDNKRKSNEAREELQSNPMKYSEYQKRKEREVEMLKTLPPDLKPYYRDKVNEYFNKLED